MTLTVLLLDEKWLSDEFMAQGRFYWLTKKYDSLHRNYYVWWDCDTKTSLLPILKTMDLFTTLLQVVMWLIRNGPDRNSQAFVNMGNPKLLSWFCGFRVLASSVLPRPSFNGLKLGYLGLGAQNFLSEALIQPYFFQYLYLPETSFRLWNRRFTILGSRDVYMCPAPCAGTPTAIRSHFIRSSPNRVWRQRINTEETKQQNRKR